jgi:outer membrane receptor for Fe3+-dicitrate
VWRDLEGSSLYAGYAYIDTRIYASNNFNGNAMPWFPMHELWSGFAYAFPWRCGFFASLPGPDDCRALKLGADVTYSATQFSTFDNDRSLGRAKGDTGLIPAYALVDVYLKFTTMLPRAWVLNLSLGIKNVANTAWYYRTDDLNRGILAQRPRTFFVGLDIGYTFFDAHARAEARRKRRAEARR